MILYNILLDDCLSGTETLRLVITFIIKVNLRNEAIIAWDMRRYLGCSNWKFICPIFLFSWFITENVSWVMSIWSIWIGEFTSPSSSGRAIGLTIDWPKWTSWLNFLLVLDGIDDSIVSCLPMRAWVYIPSYGLTSTSKGHLFECGIVGANSASIHCWYLSGV